MDRALEVYVRPSKNDQSDYDLFKEDILTNFNSIEQIFRKRFRDCMPENPKHLGSLATG